MIGGAELAGQALAQGVVDEGHLVLGPFIAGGGKPALPRGLRLALTLVHERRFDNGAVHLHYRVNPFPPTIATRYPPALRAAGEDWRGADQLGSARLGS